MTPRPPSSGSDPKKTAAKAQKKTANTVENTTEKATEKKGVKKSVKKAAQKAGEKAVAAETVAKKTVTKKATAQEGRAHREEGHHEKTSTAREDTSPPEVAAPTVPPAVAAPEPAASPGPRRRPRAAALRGPPRPARVLGAHPAPGGVAFRAFRPYARAVTVVAGDLRADLHDDGDGFFSGVCCRCDAVPAYRLLVAYADGGPGDRGPVPLPARARRAGPAPDPARAGTRSCGRRWGRADDPPGCGRDPVHGVGAERAGRAGRRRASTSGTARRSRCARSARTGVWELFAARASARATLYKFEITRPDGSQFAAGRPDGPPHRDRRPSTASVVTSSSYEWRTGEWLARRGGRPRARGSVLRLRDPSRRPGDRD